MTTLHCLAGLCLSLGDWKEIASALGTLVAIPGVLFAAYKALQEIKRSRDQKASELEQRRLEHQLKRVEFTLSQHRRLFDDSTLSSVLRILDGDSVKLRDPNMWEPKRKFLTFFEEIALLIKSGYITKEVAYYMFGYYAVCAHRGVNFKYGIAYEPEYWNLFMQFAEDAEKFLCTPAAKDVSSIRL